MESYLSKIQKPFILVSMMILMGLLSVETLAGQSYKKDLPIFTSTIEEPQLNIEEIKPENAYPWVPESWSVDQIKKHINLNDQVQVGKVLEVINTTPLDEVTASIIVGYGEKLDVPISLILSVIDIESGFDQYIVGAAQDRGYCQIIPSAEKWLTDNYGYKVGIQYDPSKIFDPEYNIGLGVLYIHLLSEAYDDNYHRVLSEYNRGPYNLEKYFNIHKTYQTKYSRMVLNNQQKYIDMQI